MSIPRLLCLSLFCGAAFASIGGEVQRPAGARPVVNGTPNQTSCSFSSLPPPRAPTALGGGDCPAEDGVILANGARQLSISRCTNPFCC